MNTDFKTFFGKYFQITFFSIIFCELVSYVGFLHPALSIFAFISITFLVFLIALKRLDIAIFVSIAELIIGSKGYLFSATVGNFNISLRLALFLVIMLAWLIKVTQTHKTHIFSSFAWKPFFILILFIAFGVLNGYLHHNSLKNIFLDVNGYLYFGFLFPMLDSLRNKKNFYHLFEVIFAATFSTILKTLFLLFIFSQQFLLFLPDIYKWVRVTGVGEITQLGNYFYRIFFQSQIYELILFLFIFSLLFFSSYRNTQKKYYWWSLFFRGSLSLLIVFISYSRSFWLGLVITMLLLYAALLWYWRVGSKKVIYASVVLLIVLLANYGVTYAIINFPSPLREISISAKSLLTERTSDPLTEAAGASRFNLLTPLIKKNLQYPILGMGFGSTVTYKTEDPRNLASNASGLYTTFSFEWGFLDLWLKLGLFGLFSYVFLLGTILKKALPFFIKPYEDDNNIVVGVCLGLCALIFIHATTPFLNHPLGIGWLLITITTLQIFISHHATTVSK